MQEISSNHGETESPSISNGETSYETWDDLLKALGDKAKALCEEFHSFGFTATVLASAEDPLERESVPISYRRGNWYSVLGIYYSAIHDMQHQGDS